MDISSIWPDIQPDMWLFSVSGIRRDIRQDKSCIQPDTGYKKGRIIWSAGISGDSLLMIPSKVDTAFWMMTKANVTL
jgi:hypothetical protein